MSYEFYKVLHLSGLALTLLGIGGLSVQYKITHAQKSAIHSLLMALHGTGLIFLLVSGFGLLAKLGIQGFPLWAAIKLILWLTFGAFVILCRKMHEKALLLLLGAAALTSIAASIAVLKP